MLILVMALGSAIKEIWISEDYTHRVQDVGKQKLCASNTRITHRWGGCWHLDAPPPACPSSLLSFSKRQIYLSLPQTCLGEPQTSRSTNAGSDSTSNVEQSWALSSRRRELTGESPRRNIKKGQKTQFMRKE